MTFDPYHSWLGIRPEEQPPNYYRLLGLAQFEDNPDVIDNAADRQMAHVRTFQSGLHAAEAQRLLNEIAAARICLLDPQSRAQYDAQLRASLDVPTTPELIVSTAPSDSPVRPRRLRKNPLIETAKIIAGGLAGVVLSVLLLRFVFLLDVTGFLPIPPQLAERVEQRDSVMQPPSPAQQTSALPSAIDAQLAVAEQPPSEASPANASLDPVTDIDQQSTKTTKQKKKGKRKAVGPAPTAGATISVARMKPVAIGDDSAVPAELRGGTRFDWIDAPTSVNVELGKLEFTVEKSGMVYLVADWNYGGNRSGNWTEEAKSKDQLVQDGWTYIGRCPWGGTEEKPLELLKRHCFQGQSFSIRVNKYWPPLPFVPPPAGPVAASIPAPAVSPPRPSVLREKRLPVPPVEQQAALRQTLEELYGISKLKTDDEKRKLAAELRKVAVEVAAKPADQFVTYRQAAELSQEVGDAGPLAECLDALAQQFELDLLQVELTMLPRCAAAARTADQIEALVAAARPAMQLALADEQFDEAARLADTVLTACSRPAGVEHRAVVSEGHKEVRRRQQVWQAYQRARAKLEQDPADGAANLTAGMWLAQERSDWPAALPHLARAGNPDLQTAAELELAMPAALAGLLAAADAWYEAGNSPPKEPLWLFHARSLYEQAQRGPLEGPAAAKVEQRLQELAKNAQLRALAGAEEKAASISRLRAELSPIVRRHCVLAFSFEPKDLYFSSGKTMLRDRSGQENHGSVTGPIPVLGRAGMAFQFDGRDDFVECPDRPSLNPREAATLCAWVKARSWVAPDDAIDYVISKDDWKQGARGYVLRFAWGGRINFTTGDGRKWSNRPNWRNEAGQPLETWLHVAAVFDGHHHVLLVNGQEIATIPVDQPIAASPFPLRVGRGAFDPKRRFHGLIDEVAVFDIALTVDDIGRIYQLGEAGTPLIE